MLFETLDFDYRLYRRIGTEDGETGIEESYKYVVKKEIIEEHVGWKSVTIYYPNERSVRVVVECSAKMLKSRYLEGINIFTVVLLWEGLVDLFGIECSLEDVMRAVVHRADITKNLYYDTIEEKMLVIKLLPILRFNLRYAMSDFTIKQQGVVFRKKIKSLVRMIIYNKGEELLLKENDDIRHYLDIAGIAYNTIIRVELNCINYKQLRAACGKEEKTPVTVRELLEGLDGGKTNLLLEWYMDISKLTRKEQSVVSELDVYDKFKYKYKPQQIKMRYFVEGLMRDCKGDENIVDHVLRRYCTDEKGVFHKGRYDSMKKQITLYLTHSSIHSRSITMDLAWNSMLNGSSPIDVLSTIEDKLAA